MFRTIRWRLVLSYVLLTLLTVGLVGVLTLSLVKQFVEQRVIEDLTANAESVAHQAAPLMWSADRISALHELARTAAFLGGVRVRILDDRQQVLADSGSPTGVDQVMWVTPPEELGLDAVERSWIMLLPHSRRMEMQFPQDFPFLEGLPRDVQLTIISRIEGVWGNRFQFEEQGLSFSLPHTEGDLLHDPAPSEHEPARSGQVISVSIADGGDALGYVELSSGPDFGAEALRTTQRAFTFAAGGAMLLAIVVGLLVSHGLTAGLTAAAGRMSDDLSTRAPVRGKDEIGQLARQFNHMAERLEASFAALTADRDALRRFIADASHELRTPITALKNFNELLQGPAVDDPAARAEFLAESAAQVERLEWITKNLLDLSRLDAGLIALELEQHDVGELIQVTAGVFKALAQEKEITLAITPPPASLSLLCDRGRIELALSNLLGNALKFTPRQGQVEIGAEQVDQSVRFWVQDNGPGIDPAEQPHIFERFYRGKANHSEGSGLGLAIVKSVVQAHGGTVWVENALEAGSRFVMELPHRVRA